jgi:hypothetical protein
MSLVKSLSEKRTIDMEISSSQIRAVLYYMVDYWAMYVESQDPEYAGKNFSYGSSNSKERGSDGERKSK